MIQSAKLNSDSHGTSKCPLQDKECCPGVGLICDSLHCLNCKSLKDVWAMLIRTGIGQEFEYHCNEHPGLKTLIKRIAEERENHTTSALRKQRDDLENENNIFQREIENLRIENEQLQKQLREANDRAAALTREQIQEPESGFEQALAK